MTVLEEILSDAEKMKLEGKTTEEISDFVDEEIRKANFRMFVVLAVDKCSGTGDRRTPNGRQHP